METLEELRARQSEIRARLQEIDTEYHGQQLPEEQRSEWNELNEEFDSNKERIAELEARQERIAAIGENPDSREAGSVQVPTPRTKGEDIYDLSTIRASLDSPEATERELRDRAKEAVEQARFADGINRERAQEHVDHLAETRSGVSEYLLSTGSPAYKRAFGKSLAGRELNSDEKRAMNVAQRALSTSGASGGFAVPFTLDPTVLPTDEWSVNPYRQISRVETITTTTWQGVNSDGVTASYAGEGDEASDDSPSLAQPEVTPIRAQAFIPFSIEIGQDWSALQSEITRMLGDAKDDLEADKFTNGTGTVEPEGVLVGGTATVNTAGTAAFAAEDVYALETDLGPRFRRRATFVGNRAVYNAVRQFDTQGGAQLWQDNLRVGLTNEVPTPGGLGSTLLGYPAAEASEMSDAPETSSEEILVLGDFGRYFIIVDRIGMQIELIPHLFGNSNRFPTGQRGIYAIWRNSSEVLSANAFRKLVVS